jgi:nucleoid DNA-binding protein
MSSIEAILTHAMSDRAFAELLFTDVDKAVAGYDLTAEEIASLKAMPRQELDRFAQAPAEERKSFSVQIPAAPVPKFSAGSALKTAVRR